MDANERELILKEEVFAVVGAAMEVLNVLGHGLIEKPYENALVVELGLRSIPVKQQPRYAVNYKGTVVGARQSQVQEHRLRCLSLFCHRFFASIMRLGLLAPNCCGYGVIRDSAQIVV